jgi:hypothetical protein
MVQITLTDGSVVYSNEPIGMIQTYVNSANSKGAAVLQVWSDDLGTIKTFINLTQVVKFSI